MIPMCMTSPLMNAGTLADEGFSQKSTTMCVCLSFCAPTWYPYPARQRLTWILARFESERHLRDSARFPPSGNGHEERRPRWVSGRMPGRPKLMANWLPIE